MTTARTRPPPSPFGELLRYWRRERKWSQLELALGADVSARHVSFVETGRSQPSREMVLRLAEVLDVPLRERNPLLAAAGFAPLYREADLSAPELAAARKSLEFLLERHDPYPAVVVDRLWNVQLQNRSALAFVSSLLDATSLTPPFNAMTTLFEPDGLRPYITNWHEVATGLIQRMHREVIAAPSDPQLRELLDGMLAADGVPDDWRLADLAAEVPVVLPIHFVKGPLELSLFSALTTLGTARDITLHELRLETFFPLDDATERALVQLAANDA